MEKQEHKTNRLINSSSPYLRQHAHNPVDWYEWGEEAFEKAKLENKMILVSIGYSACHWCHVMAHESFENEQTALLMNEMFVCIKVDREELPDVDQLYMDACQLINGSGGWPLNAFALPDKRPIHAMTYAQTAQWEKILKSIHHLWQENKTAAFEYADKLANGIVNMSVPPAVSKNQISATTNNVFSAFSTRYDNVYGGMQRAPKFPMPQNQMYLLQYGQVKDKKALEMAAFTLKNMALGGIYDAVGGGFARYSVDERWFAPHFEKMLYDNAQLIGIYAYANLINKHPLFAKTAKDSLQFCLDELQSNEGLFYSAYDADSEGIEGLYYTYTQSEIDQVLGTDAVFFSQYFQCRQNGNWEHERNILYAADSIEEAANRYEMEPKLFEDIINKCLQKLKSFRNTRTKPGLDDKCICAWNALLLKGMSQYALFTKDQNTLKLASNLADQMLQHFYDYGQLKRIYSKGSKKIDAFLEDHACFIDALITLYNAGFEEKYLLEAYKMTETCINTFFKKELGYFSFSSGQAIISEKFDINDDVINSGNSIMANNLYKLSWYFDRSDYRDIANNMLNGMDELLKSSGPWYSNWAGLLMIKEEGMQQIIIADEENNRQKMVHHSFSSVPNAIFGFVNSQTEIPLLKDKYFNEKAKYYQCLDMTCGLAQNLINNID